MAEQPTRHLRLLPTLRIGKLGKQHFVYDSRISSQQLASVPTQKISERLARVLERLRQVNPGHEPATVAELNATLEEPADRLLLALLEDKGYLEAVSSRGDALADGRVDALSDPLAQEKAYFFEREWRHFFRRPAFFNTPLDVDDQDVHVAIAGVPISSLAQTAGCAVGPSWLRSCTQGTNWFDVYNTGVFGEFNCHGNLPEALCRNVILKDYGDIGGTARSVGSLFAEIDAFVDKLHVGHATPALFVGGDHAVSFPLVHAYAKRHPGLCLIHFDAHNDLFYRDTLCYDHAATIRNILVGSDVDQVVSLGLRTYHDVRFRGRERLQQDPSYLERVHLFSLAATKQMLSQGPEVFIQALSQRVGDRPCYITIDLDVLSESAMDGCVTTPAGHGLEWHELFLAIDRCFQAANIVACDVVEANPYASGKFSHNNALLGLLSLLIDRLARAGA